jgi:preprotein translocase subunit SecG
MGIVSILILIVFVITSILLIIMVLMQDEQGEGLGGIFGGGSATPFGSRSGNVLTKTTAILGTIFIVCSFALAWLNRTPESDSVVSEARRLEAGEEESAVEWWKETPQDENASIEADNESSEEAE